MRRSALGLVVAALLAFGVTMTADAQGLDCTSFADQAGAQLSLDADPSLAPALDPDGNGVACEGVTYSGGAINPGDSDGDGLPDDTDQSGGVDTDDTTGSSGNVVGVPVPQPEAPAAPADTGTDTGTGEVPATDTGAEAAPEVAPEAAPEAAPGAAAAPVTAGVGAETASTASAVASLPNTGTGTTAPTTPVALLLAGLALVLAAGSWALRRA